MNTKLLKFAKWASISCAILGIALAGLGMILGGTLPFDLIL